MATIGKQSGTQSEDILTMLWGVLTVLMIAVLAYAVYATYYPDRTLRSELDNPAIALNRTH